MRSEIDSERKMLEKAAHENKLKNMSARNIRANFHNWSNTNDIQGEPCHHKSYDQLMIAPKFKKYPLSPTVQIQNFNFDNTMQNLHPA